MIIFLESILFMCSNVHFIVSLLLHWSLTVVENDMYRHQVGTLQQTKLVKYRNPEPDQNMRSRKLLL